MSFTEEDVKSIKRKFNWMPEEEVTERLKEPRPGCVCGSELWPFCCNSALDQPVALCSFATRDDCWDDQEARADPLFVCPIHGQAVDTLSRLGVDVL